MSSSISFFPVSKSSYVLTFLLSGCLSHYYSFPWVPDPISSFQLPALVLSINHGLNLYSLCQPGFLLCLQMCLDSPNPTGDVPHPCHFPFTLEKTLFLSLLSYPHYTSQVWIPLDNLIEITCTKVTDGLIAKPTPFFNIHSLSTAFDTCWLPLLFFVWPLLLASKAFPSCHSHSTSLVLMFSNISLWVFSNI